MIFKFFIFLYFYIITMNNIGILDPSGININPLNNKEYSEAYKNLGNIWSKFPGYQKAEYIIDSIKTTQVILIVADTGSGKTVLVPKYALHAFDYGKDNKQIGVTLPKQIIAKSAAEFAAKTLDVELGKEVGYQYKGSPSNAKSNETKLLYATDGTIKSRLLRDPTLSEFNCIIIDEAHERKIQIDFLLYLLKGVLKARSEFRVIIMSATVNAQIFKSYFSEFTFKEINLAGQRSYPIESIFLKSPIDNYKLLLDKGFEIMIGILDLDQDLTKDLTKDLAKDILFFVTSSNDAINMCTRLQTHIEETCGNNNNNSTKRICNGDTFCVEVYSGMDPKKQTLAQDKVMYKEITAKKYVRKIVIATNVAESSLTIDGIKYVIDSGYELKSIYDPIKRAKKLDRQLITVAQANQRMGRSGRTEPGVCYHLYTQNDFENVMEKYPEPDIRTSDISSECLDLLNLNTINNISNLIDTLTKFIEPPKEIYIKDAIALLMQLGLVQNDTITQLGRYVTNISNDIMAGLALVYSKQYMCSHEMIKIVSMLEVCNNNIVSFFNVPTYKNNNINKKLEEKYNKARKKFKHKYGDHLSLLKIYTDFYTAYQKYKNDYEQLHTWCYKRFLKISTMMKAIDRVKKMKGQMHNLKLNIDRPVDEEINKTNVDERIMHCLKLGYNVNIGTKISDFNYSTLNVYDTRINIDQNSFVHFNKSLPKTVIYNELFMSMGKANLNIVSRYL